MPSKTAHEFLTKLTQSQTPEEKELFIESFLKSHQSKMPIIEINSAGKAEVTFFYRGGENTTDVSILSGFSGYNVGETNRMEKVEGTNLFVKKYTLEPGAQGFTYQFAVNLKNLLGKGSNSITLNQEHGAFNPHLVSDPLNQHQYSVGSRSFSYFEVSPGQYDENKMHDDNEEKRDAFVHHRLDENKGYRVLLPDNFDLNAPKEYPVYLFTDADLTIDLMNPYSALKQSGLPEGIIVLLDSKNRIEDYLFKADQYIDLIVNEVIPHLQKEYIASKESSDYYGIGSSLGAYFMLRMAISHPEIIGNVLSQSANLGCDGGILMSHLAKLTPQSLEALKKVCIRATVGTYEDVNYSPGDNILTANRKFKQKAEEIGLSLRYHESQTAHDYIPTWRNNLPSDLRFLLEQRKGIELETQAQQQPPKTVSSSRVRALIKQYETYSEQSEARTKNPKPRGTQVSEKKPSAKPK